MTATWEKCSECDGARIQGQHCLAHLTGSEWAREITRLREGGHLDARSVVIDTELLKSIFDALDSDEHGIVQLPPSDFSDAEFTSDVDFVRTQFSGDANFGDARFSGYADFSRAQFSGDADFDNAQFSRFAYFISARFSGDTHFDNAQFSDYARFYSAQFSATAHFDGAQFSRHAYFDGAQFSNLANFDGARFSSDANFGFAQFANDASFDRARFLRNATFDGAVFRARVTIGPVVGSGVLSFDDADFQQGVRLDASVSCLSCKGTRFGGRADLNVRWAEIAVDNATFVQHSRLAGVSEFADVDDTAAQVYRVDRRLDADPRPRLLSLRQANVENLSLSNIDLSACRFFGAHGLDQLRIEADCDFAQPPRRWRYTKRRMLAEEHHRRAHSAKVNGERGPRSLDDDSSSAQEGGWHPPQCQPASWITPKTVILDPLNIASLYRALRKALEDRKDEPGAADFYYGEMEMRRQGSGKTHHATTRRAGDRAEHAILTLYWLLAGYGLRASRALTAYALTIGLAAVAFSRWGFDEPESYGRAVLFALQSSVSLLHAPQAKLSITGQVIDIVIRIAGPLLFGLALISLRGRVKR